MIEHTHSATPGDYWRYLFGGNPGDEWRFDVAGVVCRVVNHWRSGAELYAGDILLDRSGRLLSISGEKPLLSGTVSDSSGVAHRIDVYVRAIRFVQIRVTVDGCPLSDAFV